MKKLIYTCIFASFVYVLPAQSFSDSGAFFIHKFEQNIGTETYTVSKSGTNVNYAVQFHYNDRGQPVDLTSDIQLTAALEPLYFRIKGGTSRFSSIDDSVVINKKTAFIQVNDSSFSKTLSAISFPVGGYSPATAQMLLIKYWKKYNKPAIINLLPYGSVTVIKDGEDTFALSNKKLVLERYIIKGLVWGNELLWLNSEGMLYCLITNDAEGDKQEIVLKSAEPLLAAFVNKAAIDGMKLFTKTAKPSFQKYPVTAITNGMLIDVKNSSIIPGATVLIDNGFIKQAGSAGAVKIPANAYIIDAKGKTVLPGLWDMHSHFEQAEWGPAYLAAGVTTVRDCGNEFGYINTIQKTIDDGSGIGPHILKAGIIDGKGAYSLGIIQADTKEEAIAAVDKYKESGFVQIKIYSSVKPDIVKAICDEAHRLGLTVTGHIPQGMKLMQGIDSGMDMVNHVQYVTAVLKRGSEMYTMDFNDSASVAVFSFIKKHHVVVDPTLGVYELGFRSVHDSITDIEPNFSTLPLPLQTIFKNTGFSSDSDIVFGKTFMNTMKQTVARLYQDSITIVAGTDMGFPGYSLDRELELYVDCGLTPMQAIQTATITPARVMKLDSLTGSIEAGKRADIILIDGNPLQNIRSIRNVAMVIKDGNIYDPAALHKIAGFQ